MGHICPMSIGLYLVPLMSCFYKGPMSHVGMSNLVIQAHTFALTSHSPKMFSRALFPSQQVKDFGALFKPLIVRSASLILLQDRVSRGNIDSL